VTNLDNIEASDDIVPFPPAEPDLRFMVDANTIPLDERIMQASLLGSTATMKWPDRIAQA
jgi:hypothetical protein